ncbi:hypothetical protein [Paenibacillus sp. UMB4589-SE434]|uniref:hypothetical protein n=1 Tax=Paenibacillus sp. UMB4589-SE434 TaxID=3046314 RepID=UPI00254FAA19|nr:hypothetical protein [Paenibacillus sp. UMB4589-SE434]MDK8181840.1 hypothetical protein [Paenibacillus sp. UMB4589-SE434]
MKITNLALIFVLIVVPMFLIMGFRIDDQKTVNRLELQYDAALRTAAQDAAKMLSLNEKQDFEVQYQSLKYFRANKEMAVDTFFKTLVLNFRLKEDPIGQGVLKAYIPAIVIVDYDGYYTYAVEEYRNARGVLEAKHVFSPKKPYAYSDSVGRSYAFTLDDYVRVYDPTLRTWYEGYRADLSTSVSVDLLQQADTFEQVRQRVIVDTIQQDLARVINKHNQYVTRYGITYMFSLPSISQEEWNNTINDIGMIAFLQGIPVGDQAYNNYALGGGRLVRKPVIYGVQENGIKYYYRSDCAFTATIEETFVNEKEAAAHGYYPKRCLNVP